MMKKIRLFIFLSAATLPLKKTFAQIEMSSFTATGRAGVSSTLLSDYQCQGINPANLAYRPERKNRNFALGFGEMGFSIYSDALNRVNLASALFNPEKQLSAAEKKRAAQDFTNKALTVNLDLLYGGFSWQSEDGIMGFAFTIREKAQWYSKFSQLSSEIMFNGINAQFQNSITGKLEYYFKKYPDLSQLSPGDSIGIRDSLSAFKLSKILDGSRIAMAWNREYAFDFGLNVFSSYDFKLNAGIGLRYIQGIGYIDLQSVNGEYKAVIAASPAFGIEFPVKSPDSVNTGFLPNAAGSGAGLEVGASAEFGDNWRLAASITDIGAVSYKTNVYTANDGPLTNLSTTGFTNYNFFKNASQFDGFTREMVKWQSNEKKTIGLPSKVRLGGSYTSKVINFGFDVVAPMNSVSGNILKPVASLGAELKILGILRLGSGIMVGGNYTYALVPAGITFSTVGGYYEMGIATRDIFTYLRSNNPMLSLSTGFMRFRF